MKTLLIFRHAKSRHDDPSLSDHDRPLNDRGRRAARTMGQLLDREDMWPERILSSTANRAASTIRLAVAASSAAERYESAVEYVRDLYTFDARDVVEAIRELGGDEESLMVVGHNPGLENLVYYLTGETRRFPTAALARVELTIDDWPDIDAGTGELVGLWLPRELVAD